MNSTYFFALFKESENKKEKKTKKQNKQPIFSLSEKSWDRTGLDTPVVAGEKKRKKKKEKKNCGIERDWFFVFVFLPPASGL